MYSLLLLWRDNQYFVVCVSVESPLLSEQEYSSSRSDSVV